MKTRNKHLVINNVSYKTDSVKQIINSPTQSLLMTGALVAGGIVVGTELVPLAITYEGAVALGSLAGRAELAAVSTKILQAAIFGNQISDLREDRDSIGNFLDDDDKVIEEAKSTTNLPPHKQRELNKQTISAGGGLPPEDPRNRSPKYFFPNPKINNKIEWTDHGHKHAPQKHLSWDEVVEYTKHGNAKYKHGERIEALEREAWEKGIQSTTHPNFKVMKFDRIIGAKKGIETPYIRLECSANTIHGHPITYAEYIRYLK